jgi:hypothetical protein
MPTLATSGRCRYFGTNAAPNLYPTIATLKPESLFTCLVACRTVFLAKLNGLVASLRSEIEY